jgi:hypothetical protein
MRHHYFDDHGVGMSTNQFVQFVTNLVDLRDRLIGVVPPSDAELGEATA